jgi:hypothetical protein
VGTEGTTKQLGLSNPSPAQTGRWPQLPAFPMHRRLRMAAILLLAFLGTTAAQADSSTEIIEHTDAAHQQRVFGLREIPRQCDSNAYSRTACWEIYPTAWQALNKSKKGISLTINIWETGDPRYFTSADLEIVIDTRVFKLMGVHFQPGSHSYEGTTATLNDYRLVQMLAHGNEERFTASVTPEIQVKLTAEMLAAINAILDKYSSLDSPGSRLEQVDARLDGLTQEMSNYSKQWPKLEIGDNGCTRENCLVQRKKLLAAMLECGESTGVLLDEKIALLAADPQGIGVAEERNKTLAKRQQLTEEIGDAKRKMSETDKKLGRLRPTRTAAP